MSFPKMRIWQEPKKYVALLFLLPFVFLLWWGGRWFYNRGYRINFSMVKRDYRFYQHESLKFSFSYAADRFELDQDEENRFGDDYLIGIKLPSDHRVGCDVRAVKGKLDLEGDVEKVGSKLAQQVSEGTKFFHAFNYQFIKIDREKAIKMKIIFSGPLGEIMRTDQVFVAHNDYVYTLICGTIQGTYPFFKDDFTHFFETFAF